MRFQRVIIGVVVFAGICALGWLLSFPVGLFTGTAPQHSWVYRSADYLYYGTRIGGGIVGLVCAIWILRSPNLDWRHWWVVALAVVGLVYPVILRIQVMSISR